MRSKPRWTVTSLGPGKPSRITWASWRSCVPAKRRRRRSEQNSTSALSTMLCSISARYRCPLSRRESTGSSLKVAKALTRIWSEQVAVAGVADARKLGTMRVSRVTFVSVWFVVIQRLADVIAFLGAVRSHDDPVIDFVPANRFRQPRDKAVVAAACSRMLSEC